MDALWFQPVILGAVEAVWMQAGGLVLLIAALTLLLLAGAGAAVAGWLLSPWARWGLALWRTKRQPRLPLDELLREYMQAQEAAQRAYLRTLLKR
jgi:hypothetical protein